MFTDSSNYPFLLDIKRNVGLVKKEVDDFFSRGGLVGGNEVDYYSDYWVRDNGFHPEQIGYDIRNGNYSTLAIFKAGFPIKGFDAAACFPHTLSLLERVSGLHYAAFFVMAAGAHLERHKHSRSHLIYHLLLNDLLGGGCEMRCGDEVRVLRASGDEALFDYSFPHETFNFSDSVRINLVVDFLP